MHAVPGHQEDSLMNVTGPEDFVIPVDLNVPECTKHVNKLVLVKTTRNTYCSEGRQSLCSG